MIICEYNFILCTIWTLFPYNFIYILKKWSYADSLVVRTFECEKNPKKPSFDLIVYQWIMWIWRHLAVNMSQPFPAKGNGSLDPFTRWSIHAGLKFLKLYLTENRQVSTIYVTFWGGLQNFIPLVVICTLLCVRFTIRLLKTQLRWIVAFFSSLITFWEL